METIIACNKLIIVDYLRLREYVIGNKAGTFLNIMWANIPEFCKNIAFKLNYYSPIPQAIHAHCYELCYSAKYFIDYRDNEQVAALEAKTTESYEPYPECHPKKNATYYFMNPILFRNSLTVLNRIGALLYFSVGTKCPAIFNDKPHIKKFTPSNGARYPFQVSILIHDMAELKSGKYEYDMRSNALIPTESHQHLPDPEANLSILYYADVTRIMPRYPNAIYYKDLLFEYGHLLATLRSCIKHYDLDKHITWTECTNDFDIAHNQHLLKIPFLKGHYNHDK